MLKGKTYLDHGGATIYAKSLVESVSADLIANIYGNPHSASDPAHLSGRIVDETREKTLRFFGADPDHFDLVYVQNATAAIKLVMESLKGLGDLTKTDKEEGGFRYFYHADSHNSIVGVREAAKHGHHCFKTDDEVESWLSGRHTNSQGKKLGLFAYPGQSNMTGRCLPLCWPSKLRKSPCQTHEDMYSLLDAAALATTCPLNHIFSDPASAPDFTAVSFYKVFGYPDLGGLIIRRASGNILRLGRTYFGGGTVQMVTVLGAHPVFKPRKDLHSSLEDGTLPFHNIIALNAAIDTHERLYGPDSMSTISRHTSYLGKRLFDEMSGLIHSTGMPMVKIYTSGSPNYGNSALQGATISFNIRQADGTYVPYTSIVETLANSHKIYLRSGTLCNPGGIATNLGYDSWQFQLLSEDGHKCYNAVESDTEIVGGKPTGVVRASLGAMTTMENVDRLISFLREQFLDGLEDLGPSPQIGAPILKEETGFGDRAIERHRNHTQDTQSHRPHKARPQYLLQSHDQSLSQTQTQIQSYIFASTVEIPANSYPGPPGPHGTGRGNSFSAHTTTAKNDSLYHAVPMPSQKAPIVDFDVMVEGMESASLNASEEMVGRERGLKRLWKNRNRG